MKKSYPLVFIPGLLSDRTIWKWEIAHFQDRYEIIVPDWHFDRPTIAAMAAAILDGLPAKFFLVGTSMGGYISLEIVRQARDRILRLGLVSTSARPDAPEAAAERRHSCDIAEQSSPSVAWRSKMGYNYHRPDRLPTETIAEMEAMTDRLGARLFRSQQEAIISRADSRPVLPGIQCPTIVICGTHDQCTPPARSWEIASAVVGSELHLLAECGHCSTIEDPPAVNALLGAWLDRRYD